MLLLFFLACVECGSGTKLVDGECVVRDDDATSTIEPTDTQGDTGTSTPSEGPFAFLTSGAWSGDLATAGDRNDGIGGADRLCRDAAEAAGLPGTYDAWLSDSGSDAIDNIVGEGPWYAVGTGTRLFSNHDALRSQPRDAIDRNEYGEFTLDRAWTGTEDGGHASGDACADWSTALSSSDGTVGATTGSSVWTDETTLRCDDTASLYCFGR